MQIVVWPVGLGTDVSREREREGRAYVKSVCYVNEYDVLMYGDQAARSAGDHFMYIGDCWLLYLVQGRV